MFVSIDFHIGCLIGSLSHVTALHKTMITKDKKPTSKIASKDTTLLSSHYISSYW